MANVVPQMVRAGLGVDQPRPSDKAMNQKVPWPVNIELPNHLRPVDQRVQVRRRDVEPPQEKR